MEAIDFCRQAYISADKYYHYLQDAKLGKDTIYVTSIERVGVNKFRLSLSKKTMYIDSLEFRINSPFCPLELQEDDISILEYNESHPHIIVRTSNRFSSIFESASARDVVLESDLSFLVKAVKKWYKNFHERVALPSAMVEPPYLNIARPPAASDEQYKALCIALNSPVSYVWGAPGTGKTQMVLTNAILHYVDQKQIVLLMAPTNNALEQSLRGVVAELERQGRKHDSIIRLGRATTDFLFQFPEICESGSYDRLVESIQKDIDFLKKHRDKQKKRELLIAKNEEFHFLFEQYNEYLLNKANIEKNIQTLSGSLLQVTDRLEEKKRVFEEILRKTKEIGERLQKQNRYLFVMPHYSIYVGVLDEHRDEIQQLSTQMSALEDLRTKTKSALNRCKQTFSDKKSALDEAMLRYESLGFKVKALFSKKTREQAKENLHALEIEQSVAGEAVNEAVSSWARVVEQISSLKEAISQKEYLLANNPTLFQISREVFFKPYSLPELKAAFERELSSYTNFVFDDSLEESLKNAEEDQNQIIQSIQDDQITQGTLKQDIQREEGELLLAESQLKECRGKIAMLSVDVFKETFDNEVLVQRFSEAIREFENFEIIPDIDLQIEEREKGQSSLLVEQKEVFKDKYILACTVDHATLHYKSLLNGAENSIAHVFVDEAAYCSLAKAGVFFSFGAPVTLLGDHMQLPPICEMRKSNILRSSENYPVFMWDMSAIHFPDIFSEQCTFDSLIERYYRNGAPEFYFTNKVFLTKTFRFGKLLARILDSFIYNQGFHGESAAQTDIIVVDAKRENKSESLRESLSEAVAIRQYLALNRPKEFVILAPYKKQCRLIEEQACLPKGSVLTVHAAQGREWETVILSVTDSVDRFFMNSKNHTSGGAQIINTAVSRAKRTLVLVLDYEIWNELDGQMITELARNNSELYTFN